MSQDKITHELSLFIFRRDLRISDNTSLLEAMTNSESVIPLFIVTPAQVSGLNKYKSSNAIQFMIESLEDLDQQIHDLNSKCRLWVFYGEEISVLKKIYARLKFDAVYVNEDYTPYSVSRDKSIEKFCNSHRIEFNSSTDYLLLDTNNIKANNGNYYKIFTQFYKKSIATVKIRKPTYHKYTNFKPVITPFIKFNIKQINLFLLRKKFYQVNPHSAINGGRENAVKIFKTIKKFHTYSKTRNFPAISTTCLSAHNKFGTVSIREVYWMFKLKAKSSELCKQLFWRDFYYYVCVHFPNIFKYEHLTKHHTGMISGWNNNTHHLHLWCNAQTGFPIVDAAMRQLNETGFMHNRCRMIVAMFLTKDLLINWKYGERYFTTKLIDIDRCQNIGNRNWSSSFGLDNTSFLRIFNPWTQSIDYDPDCKYIKRWVPELRDVPNEHIHKWDKYHSQYSNIDYPQPMIDHEIQRLQFVNFYKKYFK
jgi:deoxyribodipyrimidine photo-lyase